MFFEDAGRIYMSPEGDAGGEAGDSTEKPGASDVGSKADDPALAKARDDAAKQRIKAREAQQAAEAAQAELAKLKKQQADILKAAGLDAGDDGGADLDAIQKQAAAKEKKARDALIRAEAKAQALGQGVRPDRVEQALKLADFSGADADLETLDVSGVDTAIAAVLQEMPELKNGPNKPGVDSHHSGSPKGDQVDLKNLQPGDWTRLPHETQQRLLTEGVVINMGRTDRQGRPMQLHARLGGDQAAHDIRAARKAYREGAGNLSDLGIKE